MLDKKLSDVFLFVLSLLGCFGASIAFLCYHQLSFPSKQLVFATLFSNAVILFYGLWKSLSGRTNYYLLGATIVAAIGIGVWSVAVYTWLMR